MSRASPEIIAWVSTHVIPYEAQLRGWLRRSCADPGDVDDFVQEIYHRLLKLQSVNHIAEPRSYLFRMARNMIVDEIRRKSVIDFETAQSLDELIGFDAAPSPERITLARAELRWVLGLIANLPGRCRQVVKLRKVYGLSQAETAKSLGISENVVEKETLRGLTAVSEMIARVCLASGETSRQTASPGARRTRQTNGHVKD